jgi:hypothetical protein
MTDFGKLCEKVFYQIEWQKLPAAMTSKDKEKMIVDATKHAIEDMFVVTGRQSEYAQYDYVMESEFTYTLSLDEELYVICMAQVEIFKKCRAQYDDMLGYTTNALSVTNADKPFVYISNTIRELEDRARLYFYKMVRYSHLE